MKRDSNYINDDLLVKYLLGEASQDEALEVQNWISEADNNKRYFEHFRLIWEQSKKLAAKSTVSEDEAWARFQQRVNSAPKGKVIEMQRGNNISWMKVAAMLILLAGGAWMTWYFVNRQPEVITLAATTAPLTDTLPDGSVVTLNKESSIIYPENFKGDMRSVKLEGEAFFNVTPDKSKPFVINVNDVTVRVVGTSFNVKSTAKETEVIVETGIVEVKKQNAGVELTPNEKAVVPKDGTPVKEENEDVLYNYYRTKEFVCNGTPLWRLVDVLNEAYGVNIIIGNNRIKNMELTTTFRNEPIDKVLEVVGETLKISVERRGTDYVLK